MEHNVHVLHQSHAPLRLPVVVGDDASLLHSVAVIVYNLGFLPRQPENRAVQTTATTTLASLADAALILRVGGLLSVMTYPRSNPHEHAVVRAFVEGLALFTSQTRDWREYAETVPLLVRKQPDHGGGSSSSSSPEEEEKDHDDDETNLRAQLIRCLEHVWDQGDAQQTWRVHENRKLGWTDAPILLTATRIK